MDRKPDPITLKLLKNHLSFLNEKFSPCKIILFGSRARGDHLENSDIDLIVISDKFKNIPFRKRLIQAYGSWDNKINLEIICYTFEEFEIKKNQIGTINQAFKDGIEL
ncbi:MAG: nucleotidyltransferase domain-containing protein [Candidatus Helarchaeota archaeon]